MKELKDRYQFIIGFAAIIILLSAFKDELKEITLDFVFIKFTASEYLFTLIISFVVIVHLYIIPYIFSTTKYSNLRIFNRLESLSYGLFLIIILSPTILFVVFVFKFIVLKILSLNQENIKITISIFSLIVGAYSAHLSNFILKKYKRKKLLVEQSELQEKELKSLEMAEKLFQDQYYAQSLLETFKVLENSIYKVLRMKNLIFRKGSFLEMLKISQKYNLASQNDIENINKMRVARNKIAHLSTHQITRQEAEEGLQFVKTILSKSEITIDTEQSLESDYFKGKVFSDFVKAQKVSIEKTKPIFMVIYDNQNPTKSKISYSLKYFTEYETTKNLIHDNFIQVLLDKEASGIKQYIPIDEPLENCLLVILTPDNEIIKSEGVYANPDEGLKRIKQSIEIWNNKKK